MLAVVEAIFDRFLPEVARQAARIPPTERKKPTKQEKAKKSKKKPKTASD